MVPPLPLVAVAVVLLLVVAVPGVLLPSLTDGPDADVAVAFPVCLWLVCCCDWLPFPFARAALIFIWLKDKG